VSLLHANIIMLPTLPMQFAACEHMFSSAFVRLGMYVLISENPLLTDFPALWSSGPSDKLSCFTLFDFSSRVVCTYLVLGCRSGFGGYV
jgi:hypothetical protein